MFFGTSHEKSIVLLVIANEPILPKEYEIIEREKYSKRNKKSSKLTNSFQCPLNLRRDWC